MKVTKRQLKRIIKEEKARILSEQSRQAKEGALLADLNMIISSIEDLTSGLYGLEDPGDRGGPAGDDAAQDFQLQIERMNEFYRRLEAHLQSLDKEFDPNAPGMR